MKIPSFRGRVARLLALLAVAVAYISWLIPRHALTRYARLDGSIGVLGGLYICSHPAASFIDLLFFGHHAVENQLPAGKLIAWIGFNLIVFFLGVLMITVGATHFVR